MSEECKLIAGGVAGDDRGFVRFVNDFNPMEAGVKRFYQVENHRAGFVRAWHGHVKEAKYVYVPRGSALVCSVKMELVGNGLAEGCPGADYGFTNNHIINKFILNDTCPKILYIPPSYANGFKTLSENTILFFYSTSSLEESKGDDIRFDYDIFPKVWGRKDENVWDEDFR